MSLDFPTLFRQAVLEEASKIKREWMFVRPKMDLPNIRRLSLADLKKGNKYKVRKIFPGWYKLAQVDQIDDWHSINAMECTLGILGAVRNWYRKRSEHPREHRFIIQNHFNVERWGRTHMQWFEWFVFFHDIGKLTTHKTRNAKSLFIGHELAGTQLLEKWLYAVEIEPPAIAYLKNMTSMSGMLSVLFEDLELTHKGIVIRAKKHVSIHELLELLILEWAILEGTEYAKNQPDEYKRLKKIITLAIRDVLEDIEYELF